MALRGSLHEFELPDIFQLIGNDGKTGQLVLYNKDDEAFVIFSHGSVIAAGNNVMNLQTVLFKFLMSIKRYSEEELNELLYLCQGEMRLFTQELVNKRYVTKEELAIIARLAIEDFACGLFLWEFGHYRFDSLDNVDDYMVGPLPCHPMPLPWKRCGGSMSGKESEKRYTRKPYLYESSKMKIHNKRPLNRTRFLIRGIHAFAYRRYFDGRFIL